MTDGQRCVTCNAELPPPTRKGSPRLYCDRCRDERKRALQRVKTPSDRLSEGANAASAPDRMEVVLEAIRERKPVDFRPLKGLIQDKSGRAWIGHASDWHIGQLTLSEETGGMYHHDIEVAAAQLEQQNRIEMEIMRDSGRTVGDYLLILNGDLLEGDDMRASQHREIEMLASEQAVRVFQLICQQIDMHLSLVSGSVIVSMVGGNHDRLSKKPGNAGLGELGYKATYAWMVGEFVKAAYVSNPRVRIVNWGTWYGHLMFNGLRVAHSHGADIKWTTGGHSGIPWNAIHVAAQRYSRMLGGYDLLFLGHGHIPAILPMEPNATVFLNGSLPGTTSWVQSSFKVVREPIQQLVEVNRHGFVAYHPLKLEVGQTEPASSIWDQS